MSPKASHNTNRPSDKCHFSNNSVLLKTYVMGISLYDKGYLLYQKWHVMLLTSMPGAVSQLLYN